jgi:drug/metabolite transporter (DMT)-like permease
MYDSHIRVGKIHSGFIRMQRLLWKKIERGDTLPPMTDAKTGAKQSHIKGIGLSAAAFSLFSLGDAAYKYLTPFYSTYVLIFYVSFFGSLLFLAVSPWMGGVRRAVAGKNFRLHVLRGVVLYFQVMLFVIGLAALPMASAYALVFAAPFIAAVLSIVLLGERAGWKQWLVIAAGFSGVLVILRPGLVPVQPASLALIGSAFLFSLSNILARRMGRNGGNTLLAWGLVPEMTICLCALATFIPFFTVPAPAHLLLLLYIAATAIGGMICISVAFASAPAAVAAPFHYIQIVWGRRWGICCSATASTAGPRRARRSSSAAASG